MWRPFEVVGNASVILCAIGLAWILSWLSQTEEQMWHTKERDLVDAAFLKSLLHYARHALTACC